MTSLASPIIIVHSLPAFGGAGLGVILPVLGTQAIPVPSIYLNATPDYPESQRWPNAQLIEQLQANLKFQNHAGRKPDLFIGYLASVQQAEGIVNWLSEQRENLGKIWVDPICGDHGRAYVSKDLISVWLKILNFADVALPNSTEIELLADAEGLNRIQWLSTQVLRATILETSAEPQGGSRGVCIHHKAATEMINLPWEPRSYRGTGDLFAACLIKEEAALRSWSTRVQSAAKTVSETIRYSAKKDAECLLLP
ncbi:MAG: bifunctional hydroxymethylpyrimidine kinase/phosphomethylpyrimidine kinase [Opitutales bacterium]|nr:bifunctional hydroxymethylpyrimidine kinase/phosphomethylpyrimidine kinase [Opitutales bacterium]NRA28077.1 bifunctional hydroxymethylpyrimidine kinase/phosphomethylpyrimidine kinase [Opitutales bacterium]